MLKKICHLLIAGSLAGCSSFAENKVQVGFSSGFSTKDKNAVPAIISVGKDMNDLISLDEEYGRLNLSLEGFANTYTKPDKGVIMGATPMVRYSYPADGLGIYGEFGAGLSYINVRTREQGHRGFNFIDQAGGGIQYRFEDFSLRLGYRFSHVSHAGSRESPNHGIDAHIVLFGFSIDY